ncbi:glycosyltransferase [Phragmitibacter flavus]|nr:nucleotide disphospho-sugar-binding domain-containing protein [Phragmitibacter flavus]
MARFVLCPFGSGGDVNPFIWLGKLLRARGHEVVVVTVPMFDEVVKRAGLEFHGVGVREEYEALIRDPRLWQPLIGTGLVFQAAAKGMRPFFEAIREEVAKGKAGEVVVAAPFQNVAGRLAREVLKVPLVTVHLQPIAMFSVHDRAVFVQGMKWLAKLPWWVKRVMFSLPNPADVFLAPEIKKLCAEHGVKAPKRVLREWLHSPDGDLCLWPEWFAEKQRDWPEKAVAVGFPLEDLSGQFVWPEGLREFLDAGDKPVLLTAGTGNAQAREFFEVGLRACEKLGRRALVGTRYREQMPEVLPDWARWFEYLPFGELLPEVAAMVHHGGIGTMSQAFAAGVPQVVVPMAHDQPDNGARMERLSAGRVAARLGALEKVLSGVLESKEIRKGCAQVAGWCTEDRSAERAVDVMEGVINYGGD